MLPYIILYVLYAFTQGSIAVKYFEKPSESDVAFLLTVHILLAPAVLVFFLLSVPVALYNGYAKLLVR